MNETEFENERNNVFLKIEIKSNQMFRSQTMKEQNKGGRC